MSNRFSSIRHTFSFLQNYAVIINVHGNDPEILIGSYSKSLRNDQIIFYDYLKSSQPIVYKFFENSL